MDATHTGRSGLAGEPLGNSGMSESLIRRHVLNGDTAGHTSSPENTNLQQAIRLADQIARRYSSGTHWSTWHTWDFWRHHTSNPPTSIWDTIHPYATCIGFCFGVAADLSATYKATPGLEHWAEKIQTLASWERDELAPSSELRPRHLVVALLTEEACVVVDLIYAPTVIVIPRNETYATVPYITINGRRGKRLFHYSETRAEGSKLEMENPKRDNSTRYRFWPIAHEEALRCISEHGAALTVPGTNVPVNKIIVIRGTVREPPTKVPGFQLDAGGWMITTCRFQVDFLNRRLTLQLPLEDWLLKDRK